MKLKTLDNCIKTFPNLKGIDTPTQKKCRIFENPTNGFIGEGGCRSTTRPSVAPDNSLSMILWKIIFTCMISNCREITSIS